MTTLLLDLQDDLAQLLENEAQRLNITPQQLVILILQRVFGSPTSESAAETIIDSDFEVLARGVVRDYREVLERLA